MKKYLLALILMVPVLAFTGCGSDDEPDNPNKPDEPKITNQILAGVWENGDIFISFTADGFYCTYLANNFIASGAYSISKDVVKCNNAYYGTELSFSVSGITAKNIKGKINYVAFDDKPTEINVNFCKSDKAPTPKENILIGKSYSSLGAYTDGSGMFDDVYSFNTSNNATITRTMKSGLKGSKTKNLNYIYLTPNIYYQQFAPTGSTLQSFYANCGTGQVFTSKVTIENGQIKNID